MLRPTGGNWGVYAYKNKFAITPDETLIHEIVQETGLIAEATGRPSTPFDIMEASSTIKKVLRMQVGLNYKTSSSIGSGNTFVYFFMNGKRLLCE